MVSITALAFIAGFALVFGVNLLHADIQRARRRQMQEQMQREQQSLQRERAEIAVANRHLYELAALSTGLAARRTFRERLGLFFEQSGVRFRPRQVTITALAAAAAAAAVTWPLTRNGIYAALACLAAGTLPCLFVVAARRRRMQRLLLQLPEAFDLISRMMRAGRTFPQAMQTTAQDASSPLSDEFGYCCDQQQLGMSPDAALRDLSRRTGLLEIKIFVLAVSIHRQSGGNLSDLLEKLADVIRGRTRIQGVINSLTAEGRLQVTVLTALPILSLIVMTVISPKYAQQLYDRPALLAVTCVSLVIGRFWMNRIVNFSY